MKKLLTFTLCIALLLGVFPAFGTVGNAAADYNIYVGDVEIESGKYLLQGATSTIGFSDLPADFDFDEASYAYVWEENLWLNNFTYNGAGYGAAGERKAAIRGENITLLLHGENYITCTTENAVAISSTDGLTVIEDYDEDDISDYHATGTLTVNASNGFMLSPGSDSTNSTIAYQQKIVTVNLNVEENGRGIMISSEGERDINITLISGELNITGVDENATAGIETLCTGTGKAAFYNATAEVYITGCYQGIVTNDVQLQGGSTTIETTGGYGINAVGGEIYFANAYIDISVAGYAYDAMHAGDMISYNQKNAEITRGDFDETALRISPVTNIVVGGVTMNHGDYLAIGATNTTRTKPSGGYAYYTTDVWGGYLELNNFSYTGEGSEELYFEYWNHTCIFSYYNTELKLKGSNRITAEKADGITVYGSLVISGNGFLSVTADYDGIYLMTSESFADAEFTMNSGALIVEADRSVVADAYGYNKNAIFTVNGGACGFVGEVALFSAYNGTSTVNIKDGTVTVMETYKYYSPFYIFSYASARYVQEGGNVTLQTQGCKHALDLSSEYQYNDTVEFTGGVFTARGETVEGTIATDYLDIVHPMDIVEGAFDTDYVKISDSTADSFLLGDVNADGKINNLDAAMILKYDAGIIELSDIEKSAANVNGDASVNNLDATAILKYDAGIINGF